MTQLSASQLQSQHKALIDALKRGEAVEITYHGQTLGVVQPTQPSVNTKEQKSAMAVFFGMHRDLSINSVEDELRTIRQGRWDSLHDL
jgi:antitoxin (DNA-binding transcriptional repressor) of toxin-antitoxin stability system